MMAGSNATRKRAFYALMAGLTAALVFCGAFLWGMQANVRAEVEASNATVATTNAVTLAEQVKQACSTGQLVVDDRNLCSKAEEISQSPAALVSGAPGVKGDKGDPGQDGEDGADGSDGSDGADSTVPGAPGEGLDGTDGAKGDKGDKGDPGEPGAPGGPGTDGANGRGITSVTCEGTGDTSYWLVTYDDGTTQTSGGPCRLQAASIPLPTQTP